MRLLDDLERKFGRFYIPNLTLTLVFGQAVVYVLALAGTIPYEKLLLVPQLVLQGEVWRLLTFPFATGLRNPVCYALGLYLFYLMGSHMEAHWGEFKYNLYMAIAFICTIAASFLTPDVQADNLFIAGSVFLAFAYLNPDFVLNLYFVLPIRIKWLAWMMWLVFLRFLVLGPWQIRFMVVAAILNFVIFFGPDLLWRLRRGGRRVAWQARTRRDESEVMHRCATCGKTDQTHPEMLFRYCSKCTGNPAYCEEHFAGHQHV